MSGDESPIWELLTDEGRYAFKNVRRYKMVPVEECKHESREEIKVGYSIYCVCCHEPVPIQYKYGESCANCFIKRLQAENTRLANELTIEREAREQQQKYTDGYIKAIDALTKEAVEARL